MSDQERARLEKGCKVTKIIERRKRKRGEGEVQAGDDCWIRTGRGLIACYCLGSGITENSI